MSEGFEAEDPCDDCRDEHCTRCGKPLGDRHHGWEEAAVVACYSGPLDVKGPISGPGSDSVGIDLPPGDYVVAVREYAHLARVRVTRDMRSLPGDVIDVIPVEFQPSIGDPGQPVECIFGSIPGCGKYEVRDGDRRIGFEIEFYDPRDFDDAG